MFFHSQNVTLKFQIHRHWKIDQSESFLKVFYIDLRKTESSGARYLILLFIFKTCDISDIHEPPGMSSIYIPYRLKFRRLKVTKFFKNLSLLTDEINNRRQFFNNEYFSPTKFFTKIWFFKVSVFFVFYVVRTFRAVPVVKKRTMGSIFGKLKKANWFKRSNKIMFSWKNRKNH